MSYRRQLTAFAAVLVAVGCAFAVVKLAGSSSAPAPTPQVSMLMDDNQLIYVPQAQMDRTLQTLHGLGVDVVNVSMVWQLVAPNAQSAQSPSFNASDPASYPPGAWSRWDHLVQTAGRLGMNVYFLLIGPAPLWAVPGAHRTRQGPSQGWAPNPSDFQRFAEAVGRRYSGQYVDPTTGQTIPRVAYWGIWNEPNERSWLTPWYQPVPGHGLQLEQPQLYRGLADAAWAGLTATGHGRDAIMVGETANRGTMTPVAFLRALYCVGPDLKPLQGAAATAFDCPTAGSFAAQHPGLFAAAFAHHPYPFPYQGPPDHPAPDPAFVTLYNVPAIEQTLTAIYAAYGLHPRGGVPLYLTEWGYKTNPPNPYVNTSPEQQGEYLNQGEYMTSQEPYIRGLNQFLLVDSGPRAGATPGSQAYWGTFQSGLLYADSSPKPSFDAYRLPIWLPDPRHGPRITIWGQLRPADHSGLQRGVIELRPSGSSAWQQLAQVRTSSREGFFVSRVNIPSPGMVRLGWREPSGAFLYSRSVPVG